MVIGRIQTSADALNGFVPAMGDCQSRARIAVNRAREAEATLARARLGAEEAAHQAAADKAAADAFAQANPGITPPAPPAYWGPNWNGIVEEAERERADAARQFATAIDDYETAANHCAGALSPAIADRLRNPQHHGLFDRVVHGAEGLGHAVARGAEELGKAAVNATEDYVHAYVEVAGFVVDHLDLVSEGLGIASMVTGFVPGLQGVSLGLAGAKMAVDTGLALAGKGDWKAVRGDAIGFALFGVGRGLTGLARARVGVDAAAHAAEDARAIRDLASEAAAGERLAQNTARITQLGNKVRHATEVVQGFAQDAGQPVMRHTVDMIRDFGAELPDGAALSLSRGAAVYATAARGVEAYGHYGEFKEARETFEKHGLLPEHHEAGSTASEPA
jgi:hypothetical protein